MLSNYTDTDTDTDIHDQDRLKKYEKWVKAKRHGISNRTARHYARMMIRSEEEGLMTMDDVYNRYWSHGRTVRSSMRNGIRLRNELAEEKNDL
jgi:hypothetical protein